MRRRTASAVRWSHRWPVLCPGSRLVVRLLLTGAVLLPPVGVSAQAVGAPLGHEHWSYDFLDALDVAGVASGWMTGVRPVPAAVVAAELRRILDGRFGAEATVHAWLERLADERPGLALDREGSRVGVDGAVELGTRDGDAFLDPGGGAYVRARGGARRGPVAAWAVLDSGSGIHEPALAEGGFVAPAGPFALMVGRQKLRAGGPGRTSAILGGGVPLDGLYLVSRRAVPFPGLGWLFGPVAWHFALAPWPGNGDTSGTWIGMGSAIARPHPRFRIGATRLARFGSDRIAAFSGERFIRTLLVLQNEPTEWDDQMLELSARLRWKLMGLPLASYVVLAQEDSPLWKEPGIVLGTALSLPVASGLYLLRHEYSAFGERARWCPGCSNFKGNLAPGVSDRIWFRHAPLGSFEWDGLPAGSPLGGYGSEHRTTLSFWSSGGRWWGRAWSFFQLREEGNLLLERWPGKRGGGGAGGALRLRPGLEASLDVELADGPGSGFEWGLWLRVRTTAGHSWR